MALADKRARSKPPNHTSPAVGSISFSTERPIVLLPEPDSPTRPSTSPFAISKLTSSTARTGRSPCPKYFLRPRTASIGALAACCWPSEDALKACPSVRSASADWRRLPPGVASRWNIQAVPARSAERTRSRAGGRAGCDLAGNRIQSLLVAAIADAVVRWLVKCTPRQAFEKATRVGMRGLLNNEWTSLSSTMRRRT